MSKDYRKADFEEDFKLVFAVARRNGERIDFKQAVKRVKQNQAAGGNPPQVIFKVTSFSHTQEAMRKSINYYSREGALELYDNTDSKIEETAEGKKYHDFISEVKALTQGQHKTTRLAMNCVVSLPEGEATEQQFQAATRNMLQKAFENQPYIYAFHNDTDHYHAHIIAGLRTYDGQRVITSKEQLNEWRQSFAASVRDQGVYVEATPALSRGHDAIKHNKVAERIRARGEALRKEEPDASAPKIKRLEHAIAERKKALDRMSEYIRAHERAVEPQQAMAPESAIESENEMDGSGDD